MLLRYAREFFDIPAIVRNFVQHRELVWTMVWRDFSAHYRGSFGGLFWSIVQPLIMMVTYTLVFSQFLKIRFTTDASPFTFAVYLLCGLLPWNAVSESLTNSTNIIRRNSNLVKRVVFPLEILPLNLTLIATIHQLIGFVLLIPLAAIVARKMHVTLFFVPVIIILQLMLSIGLNWFTASLAVYIPDLSQVISLILRIWMYLTPIFYPEDIVPPQLLFIFRLNPMARLITLYRNAFMTGLLPSWQSLVTAVILCLLFFLAGYFWFMHTKKGFADIL